MGLAGAADPLFNVDHGSLDGLADDDHTQYAKADGSRGAFLKSATAGTTSATSGGVVVTNDGSGNVSIAHQAKATTGLSTQRVSTITVDGFGHVISVTGLSDAADQRADLGLGTAALAASSDFATAAQGVLAQNAIQEVATDSSPQLGGDLDVNGQKIKSVSNNNILIDANGTGAVLVEGGNLNPGRLRIEDANGTNYVGLIGPASVTSSYDVTLPTAAPTAGSLLRAANNSTLEWAGAINVSSTVKNTSGGTLAKGTPVYVTGVSGSTPTVSRAVHTSASTMPAIGLLAQDLNDNASGEVIVVGELNDVATSLYTVGDTLYVGGSLSALQNTRSNGEANLVQNVGIVVRSHATAGVIKVSCLGRSNDLPNLNQDKMFLGSSGNAPVSTALSAVNLSKFNNDLTFEDSYVGHIEAVSNKTYYLDPRVAKNRTVTAIYAVSASGTCTATFKNGSSTIKAVSVSSTPSTSTGVAIANTSVAENGSITVVVSSNSSCLDFRFVVEYTQ